MYSNQIFLTRDGLGIVDYSIHVEKFTNEQS